MLSSFFLNSLPVHRHRLVASMLFIASSPIIMNRYWFEIVCGQNILILLRRQFVWKVDVCLNFDVMFCHTLAFGLIRRVEMTVLI